MSSLTARLTSLGLTASRFATALAAPLGQGCGGIIDCTALRKSSVSSCFDLRATGSVEVISLVLIPVALLENRTKWLHDLHSLIATEPGVTSSMAVTAFPQFGHAADSSFGARISKTKPSPTRYLEINFVPQALHGKDLKLVALAFC